MTQTKDNIKAVIFDLDNTLIDFMKMKRLSCEEAVSAMIDAGLNMKKEDALKKLFELYDKYGIEYKDIFQVFLQENTGKVDYKILSNGVIAYRRIKNGFLSPYPHVQNTLIELKKRNLKLAIVSDAPRLRAWLRLAAMRLTNFFDVVVTYDDTGQRKPHKLPFEAAISQLGLKPEEVLMVGDWPERDILGAKSLGMKTCFAKYGYSFGVAPKTEADYEISDVEELLRIV
ncbi:TIGR02253 family HAD-type hydrolase [Candidatus Woesearchaeota archaeon]|nr:TIGR02253 family HAD-type hydrolase [Candidatus Woesearchaeota archaeon]